MNSSLTANKKKVIASLIESTCDIKPQVHVNFRG